MSWYLYNLIIYRAQYMIKTILEILKKVFSRNTPIEKQKDTATIEPQIESMKVVDNEKSDLDKLLKAESKYSNIELDANSTSISRESYGIDIKNPFVGE